MVDPSLLLPVAGAQCCPVLVDVQEARDPVEPRLRHLVRQDDDGGDALLGAAVPGGVEGQAVLGLAQDQAELLLAER